jgi:hypothetical protein
MTMAPMNRPVSNLPPPCHRTSSSPARRHLRLLTSVRFARGRRFQHRLGKDVLDRLSVNVAGEEDPHSHPPLALRLCALGQRARATLPFGSHQPIDHHSV